MMSGKANAISQVSIEGTHSGQPSAGTRRAGQHLAAKAEILAAAWELVAAQGLAGLSMRNLGERVGMRAQSVYSYFASKDNLYDAMFRQGNEEFLAMTKAALADDSVGDLDRLSALAHGYVSFCVSNPVRFQLMFQRTIPGFNPSSASYAVAIESLGQMQAALASAGITEPAAVDLSTAMFTGLASQQLANDPGGDRWERLTDQAVALLIREFAPHLLHMTT